jgi:hypothetical protein
VLLSMVYFGGSSIERVKGPLPLNTTERSLYNIWDDWWVARGAIVILSFVAVV